jgi:hypothetical protein
MYLQQNQLINQFLIFLHEVNSYNSLNMYIRNVQTVFRN